MTDLILWSVMLWAVATILLHLKLILYATIYRNSNWWESPWGQRIEVARRILAWIIGALFLAALLTSCANPCPCRPKIPPDPINHRIQIPTLGSVADLGIGINCTWSY